MSPRPAFRRALVRPFRRLRRAEDGSGTVEFALILPFVFGLFLSCFELGMLLTRQMMLDHGLDVAVREVRLGTFTGDVHGQIKDAVCDRALLIPDCRERLTLAMTVVNPRAWNGAEPPVRCRDVDEDALPANEFRTGAPNELVILRACAVFRPFMPFNGLGFDLVDGTNGTYALVAESAYAVEPN